MNLIKHLDRSGYAVRLVSTAFVLFCFLLNLALPVAAAAVTVKGSMANISVTAQNDKGESYGSVSISGSTISIMAKGWKYIILGKSSTTTVTITANADMTISYTADVTSGSGSVGSASGTGIELSEGSTHSFTVTSEAKNNAETLADVVLTIQLSNDVTTTFGSTENGKYTVKISDGTEVFTDTTTGGTDTRAGSETYTAVATPDKGYEFGYWVDGAGNYLSENAQYSFNPNGGTVKPVFYPAGSGRYYIAGTPSVRYGYLDQAIEATKTSGESYSGTIVVCKSGTVSCYSGAQSVSIPAGVTLLLPYNANDISIKSGTSQTNDFKHANVAFKADTAVANTAALDPTKNANYTLTVPSGFTLSVADGTSTATANRGRIVIGGTIVGYEGNASSRFEGVNYGDHANLVVNGNLDLGDYAVLSAVGYVLGTGEITATSSGAEIYQPLAIRDWRGAAAAAMFIDSDLNKKVTIQSDEGAVSPYSQWGTFNIQTKLTMKSGNFMYLYASLRESDAYCSHPLLIGDSSGGLLQLNSNATLTSEYKTIDWSESKNTYGFPGKTTISIDGGASLGSMTMSIKLQVLFSEYTLNVDTSKMTLPVSYCYDFVLNNGQYNIENAIALLPGTCLTVNEGAFLNVGQTNDVRFMVFDGLNNRVSQHNGETLAYTEDTRANEKNYPTTTELQAAKIGDQYLSGDAELVVDGTLVIGEKASFGGVVQTTGGGTVDATSGVKDTKISAAVQVGVVGQKNVNYVDRYVAGMTLHQLNARIISKATGESVDILRGYTYSGMQGTSDQDSYSFKYYPNSGNVGYVVLVGDAALAEGETLVKADGTITDGATPQAAHPLNETIRGTWCAHSDADPMNHLCDTCSARISDCVDANSDLECDICKAKLFKLVSMSAYADARTELVLEFEVNSELADEDYITVSFDGKAGSKNKDAEIIVEGTTVTVLQPVASGLMTENVVVSITDGTNPAYVVGTSDTTISRSVVDYARLVLQQEDSQFDAAKELVTAMVIYGGYAQKLFNEDAENPAYDVLKDFLTEEEITQLHKNVSGVLSSNIGMTLYANTLPTGFRTGDDAKPVTQNVVLDSAIEQTVYFYLEDGYDLSSTVELSYITNVDENPKSRLLTPAYDEENSRYYISIMNIPAALLSYDYTITGTVNGESFTITPSIASYIQRVIESNGDIGFTDETDKIKAARMSLVKAMWLYNQAAYKFFSQKPVTEVSQ